LAGAIDLYAGSPSIAGSNLFQIDHNPLDQLDQGIQDVIGQGSSGLGANILTAIETVAQAIIDTILGLPIDTPLNFSTDVNAALGMLGSFIDNLLTFLGDLNPLDPNFLSNMEQYAAQFIESILAPTGIFDLAQQIIDALTGESNSSISGLLTWLDGFYNALTGGASSTLAGVESFFTNLLSLFGLSGSALTASGFDPLTAIETFITDILAPNGLTTLITNLIGSISTDLGAVWAAITGIAGATVTDVQTLFSNLASLFGIDLSSLSSGTFDPLTAIENFITNILQPNGLTDWITNLLSGLGISASGISATVLTDLESIIGDIGSLLTGANVPALQTVIDDLQSVIDALTGGTGVIADITTTITDAISSAASLAQGIIDTLTGSAAGTGTLGDLVTSVQSMVSNAVSSAVSTLTSLVQGVIDTLTGAASGTGTLADLQTWLANLLSMFGVNLTDLTSGTFDPLTTIENFITNILAPNGLSTMLDNLLSSLGISSSGISATVLTDLSSIANEIGSLLGISNIPDLQTLVDTLTGGSGSAISAVASIPAAIGGVIDTLMQGWGATGSGYTLADLLNAAMSIPSQAVAGVLGGTNIGTAIEGVIDSAVQALSNDATSAGNGLSVFTNLLNDLSNMLGFNSTGAAPAGSLTAIAQTNSEFINQQSVTQPLSANVDPTTDAVFPLSNLASLGTPASLPLVALTAANSVVGFISTVYGGVKESIDWIGYPQGGSIAGMTGLYLNIWSINTTTGVPTLVWQTPASILNQVSIDTKPDWNALNLPTANFISSVQGAIYAVEMVLTGSGQYNVVGMANAIPAKTGVIPAMIGAQRGGATATAPNSLPVIGTAPSFVYDASTPWFGMSGTAGQTQYVPNLVQLSTPAGPTSMVNPAVSNGWANYFDIVVCGAGGGGSSGGLVTGGDGGSAGLWAAATFTRAQMGTANITVQVGAGGAGGQGPGQNGGSAGTASYVSVPGQATITGAGGAGCDNESGGLTAGAGVEAGNYPHNTAHGATNTYYGGLGGATGQTYGAQPGGGGAGGNADIYGSYISGGNGGPGVVFILAYQ